MTENTKVRVRRTADQILADAKEQLAKAEAKVAQEQALDIPGISDLVESMDSARNAATVAARNFSGPQSIANRRKTFELKFTELDALEALSKVQKDFGLTVATHYENGITAIVNRHTENEMCDDEIADAVREIENSVPRDYEVYSLQSAFDEAHQNRKDWTIAKASPKRKPKDETDSSGSDDSENGENSTEYVEA